MGLPVDVPPPSSSPTSYTTTAARPPCPSLQAGVPLLFWTCANEVTPMTQAKRFYPLFAILGNLGPIASGQTMAYVSRNRPAGMDAEMAFERTLKVRNPCTNPNPNPSCCCCKFSAAFSRMP